MTETTLNYHRSGLPPGEGATLVLVHGFLLGSGFWRPQIEHLTDRFDIIAPDLPGFAGSGQVPAVDSIEDLAGSVIGLLDALGVDRFLLIGHSMGGYVVQQMALDAGARIDKLVVYGSCSGNASRPPAFEQQLRKPEERRAVLEKEGVDGLRRWMAPYWFAAGEDSPFIDACYQSGVGGSVEAASKGAGMMSKWDITDRLADITMPTLVIGGDRDLTFPVEAMTRVARDVADGQLCILPGAAHCPNYERAEDFNRVVGEFLIK